MGAERTERLAATVDGWLGRLEAAVAADDPGGLQSLFLADSHWRDLLALTWRIVTLSGAGMIAPELMRLGRKRAVTGLRLHPGRCPPRVVARAGVECLEAMFAFETDIGRGSGLLRFRLDGPPDEPARAWTLLTALDEIRGHEEAALRAAREGPAFDRDFHGPNWLDRRRAASAYDDRDPAVLVVGAGHAGLTIAARLNQLGVDTLVVDRMQRLGDNWRLRYHGLKLHNQVHSNHLPYLAFPETFPTYIPKDMIANWLELYAEAMEINVWTGTTLEGGSYDDGDGRWSLRLSRAEGGARTMRPRHLVMATSVSGTPITPRIPTLERFGGAVVHSSGFTDGAAWRGRDVLVFGTGTSAHDIVQDLHGNGARVTMIQRSPTLVVNIEPSAQLYDGVYLGPGPSLEDRDLINASVPLAVMRQAHRLLTDQVRELDRPLLDGLERAGFRLDFGEDGTGWPLKYRTRGGGYYFNAGCSDLIAAGRIRVEQYADIAGFEAGGARLADGRLLPAALIVLATGYRGQDHMVRSLLGDAVADRTGPVWGFDPQTQELRNMWQRTGHPGLWFTAGAFSQCRNYSKYLALAIKAQELGLPGA